MPILGSAPLGFVALGALPDDPVNASPTLSHAVGVGAAGSLTAPQLTKALTGVAGIGTVGGIKASSAVLLIGVAGVGQAGSETAADSKGLTGVAGAGSAGLFAIAIADTINGVKATGVAGNLTPSVQAFLAQGASGIGVAGQFIGNPAGVPSHAVGIGLAGIITIVVSGGGGIEIHDERPSRKKRRTGLEPIAKRPPPKPKPVSDAIPLPPSWLGGPKAPDLVPAQAPAGPSDPDFAHAMPAIAQQIMDAEDVSAVMHRLREEDYDAQDLADIADMMALLD